jgi:SAM-dependent MidA family methyltransferase
VQAYAPLAANAQKLLSPAEMGELFKFIALGKGVQRPLLGYRSGDKSHTL